MGAVVVCTGNRAAVPVLYELTGAVLAGAVLAGAVLAGAVLSEYAGAVLSEHSCAVVVGALNRAGGGVLSELACAVVVFVVFLPPVRGVGWFFSAVSFPRFQFFLNPWQVPQFVLQECRIESKTEWF